MTSIKRVLLLTERMIFIQNAQECLLLGKVKVRAERDKTPENMHEMPRKGLLGN